MHVRTCNPVRHKTSTKKFQVGHVLIQSRVWWWAGPRRELIDPAIASYKGRIVKTTGDGMLVEFASAVDATTCAMFIQEKMAERNAKSSGPHIDFRIGINIGDIIIDGDDIFGDGVNVAARVENECGPGGVYLSANAFEQVRSKTPYAFTDLGDLQVGGSPGGRPIMSETVNYCPWPPLR